MSDDVFSRDFNPDAIHPYAELVRIAEEPVPDDPGEAHAQERRLIVMARMAVPPLVKEIFLLMRQIERMTHSLHDIGEQVEYLKKHCPELE